jgi:hypothetical protein
MSTNRFAGLKARATGRTAHSTDAVADYIADLDELAEAGIGLVFIDPFLPFLRDVENELVTGLAASYTDDDILAIDHADYADLCQSSGFKGALSEVGSVKFLVLSEIELGRSESQSRFFKMGLEPLIEHRWRETLPTFITTRHTAEELADAYPQFWSLIKDRNLIEQLR